jgi:hypothetical protein
MHPPGLLNKFINAYFHWASNIGQERILNRSAFQVSRTRVLIQDLFPDDRLKCKLGGDTVKGKCAVEGLGDHMGM